MKALRGLLLALVLYGNQASAAEIKVFTSRAIATVLEKVGTDFERGSGHKLEVLSGFSHVFVKQINAKADA